MLITGGGDEEVLYYSSGAPGMLGSLYGNQIVCCHKSATDGEIDGAVCRERTEAEERQMDGMGEEKS